MKSEPSVYSIDDLAQDGNTLWEGVRNYQARNLLKTARVGDLVLFYHSNATPPGVAGLGVVSAVAVPDPTQFDKKSPYFDPKSDTSSPRWWCPRVSFVEKWPHIVSLETLKNHPALSLTLLVVKRGQRLSVQSVSPKDFELIVELGRSTS